ncbi:glycosyltransferase family 4 protein [Bacillaceae bacterium W0354]
MKRVLIAATVFTHIANFHIPTIKLLKRRGFEVHVLANSSEGGMNRIEELDVVCHDIPLSRKPFSLNNLYARKEIKALFKKFQFDFIHVHTPIAALLIRYLAFKHNQGKVIYTAHGFHFYKGSPLINWLIYYPAEKIAQKWTDGIIVMNKEDYNIAKKMGYKPNVSLFYTKGVGIDLDQFKPTNKTNSNFKKQFHIPSEDIVVTCIAEFSVNKNQRFLVEIWKEVERKFENVHLVFVGKGEQEGFLKSMAKLEQLERIHFLGFRQDVNDILCLSDCVTLVSKREGLPKSLMEAMACGLPAIVTDIRGCRDLITHGENGFVVPCDNHSLFIHYLTQLVNDSKLRYQMGQKSLTKVKQYNLKEVMKGLENIYQKLLQHSWEM